jgi:hypothetical protein
MFQKDIRSFVFLSLDVGVFQLNWLVCKFGWMILIGGIIINGSHLLLLNFNMIYCYLYPEMKIIDQNIIRKETVTLGS